MRIPFRSAFGAILSIAVLAAPVTFTAGGKAGTTFKGKELKQLTASAKLPQKLGAMKFDRIRVVMKLSHLDVVASIVYDRANVPAAWMGANALKFDLVRDGDGSDFEGYGLKDFTSVPQRRKLDEMSAEIKVLLLKKIGEKEEKRWDESRSAFVKSKIPVFDAGTSISEGTVKVLLERQAGGQDKEGRISVAFPDGKWVARVEDKHISSGLRSVHSLVRSTREADEAIPVDLEVYAFAFDLGDWPELKDKGWPGLKDSVAEEFLKQDKKVDFGWGFLLEEKGQRAMGSVKLAWMPTTVAGQPGLLVQCPGRPNLYLTARPPYVIAAFTEYRTDYVNKRMGKEMPLSPDQQAVIKKTLEDFITAIKPQKGEAPTGNWVVPAK